MGELLKAAGAGSGAGADTVKNFFSTLAENNRLGLLQEVCAGYAKLISAGKGEVELTITSAAPLDQKVLKQLETSVGKSAFVGQGKKLKVVPKVSFLFVFEEEEMLTRDVGQPGYQGWFDRGGWRQDNRFERLGQDGQDEQAAQGHFVGGQKHIWTPFIQAE